MCGGASFQFVQRPHPFAAAQLLCDAYGATKRVAARIATRPSSYGTVWYVMIERISTFPAVDALIERHIHICDNYIHITPHHTYNEFIYHVAFHLHSYTHVTLPRFTACFTFTPHTRPVVATTQRSRSHFWHTCAHWPHTIELNKKKFKKRRRIDTFYLAEKITHTRHQMYVTRRTLLPRGTLLQCNAS